jgi:hypothetical protein
MAMAKVTYLKNQDDCNLRLDKCDAIDVSQMNILLHSLPVPIAGCFHMTLALSDALFFNQTHDTFRRLYDSKLRVFEVFSAQIKIESLDFFVALSSVTGLIGVPGVSNYARFVIFLLQNQTTHLIFSSACTALDGVLARYPNAFSLITPGILDVGYIVSLLNDSDSSLNSSYN